MTLVSDSSGEFEDDLASMLEMANAAELEVRVEMSAPRTVSAGQLQHSKLFISNEGAGAIDRLEVKDLVGQLQTVVSAEPDAKVETAIGSTSEKLPLPVLHREMEHVAPGAGHEFELGWVPNDGRKLVHRARVIAHAAVATTTEVIRPSDPPEKLPEIHPSLACDVQYLEKAKVGDTVDMELTVRNTGDIPLHDVKVVIDIPQQFSHPSGKRVVFDAGNLKVKGQNQTVLKLAAKQVGDGLYRLAIKAAEPVDANGTAKIVVVEREKVIPTTPAIAPVENPPKTPPAPAKPAPVRIMTPQPTPSPGGPCGCQQASINISDFLINVP